MTLSIKAVTVFGALAATQSLFAASFLCENPQVTPDQYVVNVDYTSNDAYLVKVGTDHQRRLSCSQRPHEGFVCERADPFGFGSTNTTFVTKSRSTSTLTIRSTNPYSEDIVSKYSCQEQ